MDHAHRSKKQIEGVSGTKRLHVLPHRVCESTCYVNGLEDILAWKNADYTDFLLSTVGGMASFTYLRIKRADPPCMVFWGANPKYLMKDLASIIGFKEMVSEGRSFDTTFKRLKDFLDNDQPVVAGALDMYYLHYYPELYGRQHIPIHYVLVVGYDDDEQAVFVHDCGQKGTQKISYEDFRRSLDVNVPGMSKKNTIRAFTLPDKIPSELEVAEKGFIQKAKRFLNPPVKLFGAPAIRKLAVEIIMWDNKKCFEHMVTYATSPPVLPRTFENSHGQRYWQADVLSTLGKKYHKNEWITASAIFRKSGDKIKELCRYALKQNRQAASRSLLEVADLEERAYKPILIASER